MENELRFDLPEPEAQPWLDAQPDKPLNRRGVLQKVLTGSLIGIGAGFQVIWPGQASARVLRSNTENGWGNVKGRIIWGAESPPPKPREIDFVKYGMRGNDLKWFTSKGPVYTEDWVVSPKDLGVRWVFVWLMPSTGGSSAKLPVHPSLEKLEVDTLIMEQPCSGFAPHAIALREGQKILVKNDSPVTHALQWSGSLQSGNQAMPPGARITVGDLLYHRQALRVTCAPHPWEGAWWRVFNHPYFALTDPEGRFEIKNAPEGEHRMVVWHETAGWLGGSAGKNAMKVSVPSGETVDLGQIGLKPLAK